MKVVAIGKEELANGLRAAGVEAFRVRDRHEFEKVFSEFDPEEIGLLITNAEFEDLAKDVLVVGVRG